MDLISKHEPFMTQAFEVIAQDICAAQANAIDLLEQDINYVHEVDDEAEKLEVQLRNEYRTKYSKYITTNVKIFSRKPHEHAAIKVNFLVSNDIPVEEAVEIISLRLYEKYYLQYAETRDKTIEIRKRVSR